MHKRKLGHTDLFLSPIGLGTVKFGRHQGLKYPQAFSLPKDKEIAHLLALAKDLGVNVLDTAPAYGHAESRLGQLLTHRKDWVVISKTGELFENGRSTFNFTPEYTKKRVMQSLKNLKTDYLDVLLVHSDGHDLDIVNHTGVFDALRDLKQAGFIRAYGMSSKTLAGGLAALKQSDLAMITYHPKHTEEKPMIDFAQKHHKGILIKKGLASGHLDSIGGENPIKDSLTFIFQQAAVTSLIIGTINPEHLHENILLFNTYVT